MFKLTKTAILVFFTISLAFSVHAQVMITEFMAINSSTDYEDEDGDRSDWIELLNTGPTNINLGGWHLTDDADDLTGWEISPVVLAPNEYIVIWASGKNRKDPDEELHTNFKLSGSGEYLAIVKPDGTTVVHEYSPEYPGQVDDVSYGGTLYYSVPTPGSVNQGGVANIGPQFSKEGHSPLQPTASEDLTVSVKVVDSDGVTSVTMTYEIMFDGETTVTMTSASNDIYTATIPASAYDAGEMIRYRFNATDRAANDSRWPLFYDSLNSPEFFGTMAQVAVTSSMPVYHWFVDESLYNPDDIDSDGYGSDYREESRSSIFYNGVLYDNIMTRTRGSSTIIDEIPKKSHKFDFNRGHHFEHNPDERKVEEMNLNTTFSDKTYLRRMLSWQSYEDAGEPSCQSFLVHLRRNNAFYGVQNFEEQIDEDFLIRNDYDPNGALYKMQGTTASSAEKKTRQDEGTTDIEDLISGMKSGSKESFMFDNFDLANFINYMALTAVIQDDDNSRKNHYYYRDSDWSGDWTIFAWDEDLTFGMVWTYSDTILHDDLEAYGNLIHSYWGVGSETYIAAILAESTYLKDLYYRRLRTVTDQLLQTSGGGYYDNLISQLLAAHNDDLLLDYGKWGPWTFGDYDKRSNYTPTEANDELTGWYLGQQRNNFYSNGDLPSAQSASISGITISDVEVTPASGNQLEEYIELNNANGYAVDLSGWSVSNAVTHVLRAGSVIPANGKFYLSPNTGAFRSRTTGPRGGQKLFVQGSYKGMLSSYGETLTLHDASGTLKDTETWAANLSDAQESLRISEVMYHPALPNGADFTEDHLEFVELKNIGSSALDIGGTFFSQGLIFTNPAVSIPAGEYLVIASDPTEFANQYDTNGITVLGPFDGYLGNGSDTIELEDARGETIHRFKYNDDWYHNTDGIGFSLTMIDPASTNLALWDDNDGWRTSLDLGGSPGTDDSDLAPDSVIINEVLAHSDTGGDWVEIKNMTNVAVDISHWFLSDDWSDLKKYQIPASTTLSAGGFVVLHEVDFNSGANAFALSELGDEVILSKALSDGTLQGYQVSRDFDASGKDVSFGRWIDSEGDKQFIPMASQTPGAENSAPRTGPIVISEIMYAPATNSPMAEYVELFNSSGSSVSLYDEAAPTNGWSLSSAIDYTFESGDVLGSGEHLIVCSTNPTAFRAQYSVPAGVEVYGPFDGALNNAGERVKLRYPGNPELSGYVPQIQLESVNYDPILPWPVVTPGTSIERTSSTSPANDPTSWTASTASGTPGTSTLTSETGVDATGVSVSPASDSIVDGTTVQLSATVAPANAANKSVTWDSLNPTIATVNANGLVTGLSAGTATIRATTDDGGFTDTSVITVTPIPVTGVDVSPTSDTIVDETTVQLSATVYPADAADKSVTWSSLNPAIASVNSSGLVTGEAEGTVTIRVTTTDGSFTADSTITVTPIRVTGVSVSPTSGSVEETDTLQLTETVYPANAADKSVTWSSLQPSIASVNSSGLVTGVAEGTATIRATTVDGGFEAISVMTVTAIPPQPGSPVLDISIENGDVVFNVTNGTVDAYFSLLANDDLTDADGWDIVASNQLFDTIGDAMVTNELDSSDQLFFKIIEGESDVPSVPVTGVSVSPATSSIEEGTSTQLSAIVSPTNADDKSVVWNSLNPSIATVNSVGLVIGVSEGTVSIVATTVDGGFTSTNVTTVTPVAVTGVEVSPTTSSIEEGATAQLSATVSPVDAADKSVTWSSLNLSIATVNSSGLVTGVAEGTASIVVTTVDGGFTSTNVTTVTPVAVTGVSVSPTTDSVAEGSTIQLTETVSPANAANQSVTWSSLNPATATVDSSGLVTGVAMGTATIRVTTVDGSYTADSTITVISPLPTTLTIEAESFDSTGGGTYVNYTAYGGDGNVGVMSYTTGGGVGGINFVQLDDYAEYENIEVAPGVYQVEYFTGSPMTDPGIELLINGSTVATDSLPGEGDWDTFVSTVSPTQFSITAGEKTIRIIAVGTGEWQWNMDRFVLTRVGDLP